ncbi:hypothetical protein [Streptomyces marianii]|uniref:Uncharacterized protein n=1 Tax=Streptomyces marianii TaxID=1817406 RepID=A0A5R9DRH6_9ACTN|nr:hypothetical protein [Streptomyces marianii]TLQ39008.1 hypothetical protein FEF34_40060 [Streptomyces marianii]
MTDWSTTTLVRIDDPYDRNRSDTGAPLDSRFGRYLARRVNELEDDERTNPVDFLIWAWNIATPPVMSPGYVRIRHDLKAVRLDHSEEDRSLLLAVEVPVRHHILPRGNRPPYNVSDWEENHHFGPPESYRPHYPPRDESRPALLLSAVLRLPAADWTLHKPGDWSRVEEFLVDDAKQAVATAVDHINRTAGPRIAALLGDEGGAW